MRYQVKWVSADGVQRFGIFREQKRSVAIVDDAVLPYCHRVPAAALTDVELGIPRFVPGVLGSLPGDEYHEFVDADYKRAVALSDSLGDGLQVGKLFNTSVGDGRAYYVVTKVGAKSVKVEWRGYCPDRYTDAVLGWGGSFPKPAIERLVKMGDGLAKLFGGQ
jgi:hypothetical protein